MCDETLFVEKYKIEWRQRPCPHSRAMRIKKNTYVPSRDMKRNKMNAI